MVKAATSDAEDPGIVSWSSPTRDLDTEAWPYSISARTGFPIRVRQQVCPATSILVWLHVKPSSVHPCCTLGI